MANIWPPFWTRRSNAVFPGRPVSTIMVGSAVFPDPARPPVSVYTLLVLRSLLVFDALLLLVVGTLLAWFMDWPAGAVFGASCWLGAGMMFGGVRFADRLYDRRN